MRTKDGGRLLLFDAMNQRCTRHDDSLRKTSDHAVREDMICKHPSDVGSFRIMICSQEEEDQSSEGKELALQHCGGRCADNHDLRSSLENQLVFEKYYAVERSSNHNGSLSRHSSNRITKVSSDVSLATYQAESSNTATFGRRDFSNGERDAILGAGGMSPSQHRTSEREQVTNHTDQPHHNLNVSGWQQTSKSPTDRKDESYCRGGSFGYSRRMIDRREQDLYSTTNHTDQSHQHYNVSSWQHTWASPTDSIKGNPREGSVDCYIRRTIEISPGVYVRLRGAKETWDCIGRDFYIPCTCFACSQELCCIQDADYVLCPTCRVMSPMDTTTYSSESNNATAASSTYTAAGFELEGGVGLGFTFDDLLKWQAEIIQGRGL